MPIVIGVVVVAHFPKGNKSRASLSSIEKKKLREEKIKQTTNMIYKEKSDIAHIDMICDAVEIR